MMRGNLHDGGRLVVESYPHTPPPHWPQPPSIKWGDAMTQLKCFVDGCDQYRRTFTGRHGIVVHVFMDHQWSGDDIQARLLNPRYNGYGRPITALGDGTLGPSWWDDALKEEPE